MKNDISEDKIIFNNKRKNYKNYNIHSELQKSKSQTNTIHKNKFKNKKNIIINSNIIYSKGNKYIKTNNYFNEKIRTQKNNDIKNYYNNQSIYAKNFKEIGKNNYINNKLNNTIFIDEKYNNNENNKKNYLAFKNIYKNNLNLNEIYNNNNNKNIELFEKIKKTNHYNNNLEKKENYDYYKTNSNFYDRKEIINESIKGKVSTIKSSLSDTNILKTGKFNIIYLIDTTFSMKKYETFIHSLPEINQKLKEKYTKIKIGYVFYKDKLSENLKISNPSKLNIDIPKDLEFSGGYDYSEHWGLPIFNISKIVKKNEQNIVIHICDSNACGKRFSDYDEKNEEEEEVLIHALKKCVGKNVKFIGLLIDNFATKSFYECKKIYNKFNGYYEIIDLGEGNFINNNYNSNSLLSLYNKLTIKIKNIINGKYIIERNNFYDIDEQDFIFDNKLVEMKPLYKIEKYKGKKFTLLPRENFDKKTGITQGNIGDCYLISSIISMSKFPFIFNYIFQNSLSINERSEYINMFVYENELIKQISFKNTYATNDGELLFSKPKDNEMLGIALEKGFAALKCQDNKIESGYKKMDNGGLPYQVFETILGAKCEKYFSNDYVYYKANLNLCNYKYIDENNLKKKIIKYIDLGGLIAFGVYLNIGGGHAYSLIDYKIDENKNMFIELINPNREGGYEEENIYLYKDINKTNKFPIIYEEDFINKECRESLYSYYKTGYLIMEFKTFFKWYSTIDMCDPMIGFYEQIIEFIPNGKNEDSFNFKVNEKSKYRAYIFIKNDINRNINNYNLIIKNDKDNIIYNDESDYNNKIFYGYLEQGDFTIKIKSNFGKKIEDVIYLKIYSPEKITKNDNNYNNNIINLRYKFFEISQQYYFVKSFIPKFYKFLKNNDIELFETPKNGSLYDRPNSFEKLFYYDVIHTTFGFVIKVIFKYKWKYIYKIKHRYNEINYNIITAKGDFKCTKDFQYFDFSDDFKKNIFKNNEVKEPIKWSETFIKKIRPLEYNINNNIDIAINKIPNFKAKIEKVDIVYLIDSTFSMGEELKNATKLSINNAKYLNKNYPNINFKFGFIYYTDPIDVPNDTNSWLDLTEDFTQIQKFCDERDNQDGGDFAEDWAGGYALALTKIKWRNEKKFIIHICDAPAHGALFSNGYGDLHTEQKYENDLIEKIEKCAEKDIEIIGLYKGVFAINSFLECQKIYENKGKNFTIQEYNPYDLFNLI